MLKANGIPVVAIRVFAAVGRHGNFTRAAAALGITQSAVSRHIATLESLASQALFVRKGPNVAFTPEGSQYYEAVRDAVLTIELATQQLVQKQQSFPSLLLQDLLDVFWT